MKKWISKYKLTLIGLLVGAVGGYIYWRFVGCSTGGCPITSNPYATVVYGALFGAVLFHSSPKKKKENESVE